MVSRMPSRSAVSGFREPLGDPYCKQSSGTCRSVEQRVIGQLCSLVVLLAGLASVLAMVSFFLQTCVVLLQYRLPSVRPVHTAYSFLLPACPATL